MFAYLLNRPLPPALERLADLALDLRWTWSHATDRLWERLDPEAWERTRNPYVILQNVSQARLEEAAEDPEFSEELRTWLAQRQRYLQDPGWFGRERGAQSPKGIAYFSMEFGLGEALPIYSGGLGILAGDFLKTASDLGVPVVGIGLLYQQGYFRQILALALMGIGSAVHIQTADPGCFLRGVWRDRDQCERHSCSGERCWHRGADTKSVSWEVSRHDTEESARGEEFYEAGWVVSGRMYQAETGWQLKWQSG